MTLNTGIVEAKRLDIAKGLSQVLAESYTLYLKTHKYHWNITGPMFQSLHTMFETQYNELSMAVDEIAERIRVLGVKAPGSYQEFSELSQVKEDASPDCPADTMIKNLLADHEQIVRTSKNVMGVIEGGNDEGSNALLSARIEYHEKTAWMLRSLID
jgi:starvation-inducible DNA-binding protein